MLANGLWAKFSGNKTSKNHSFDLSVSGTVNKSAAYAFCVISKHIKEWLPGCILSSLYPKSVAPFLFSFFSPFLCNAPSELHFIFYFITSLILFHTSEPVVEFPLTLMLPPAVDPVPVEMLPPAIFPIPGTSKETLSDIFPITEFIFLWQSNRLYLLLLLCFSDYSIETWQIYADASSRPYIGANQ